MHQLEKDGSRAARDVNRLVADRERLIGALLLGNTFINILASSLATALLEAQLGPRAVAVTTAVMTLVILVFAEVLPKTLAIARTDRFALARGARRCAGSWRCWRPSWRRCNGWCGGCCSCSGSSREQTRKAPKPRMRKFAARWRCITRKAASSASIAT